MLDTPDTADGRDLLDPGKREEMPEEPSAARTVAAFVRAVADAYGDRPAVVSGEHELTYRDLERRSAVLARGLLAQGVGKGTRIGLLFANGPDWAVTWAAISRVGAVAVPLSTVAKPPELARLLRHGDLHGVIAARTILGRDIPAAFEEAFAELRTSPPTLRLAAAPYLRWLAFAGADLPPWARTLAWLEGDVDSGVGEDLLHAAEAEVHPSEPSLMIYTSGQSADPKGVIHSHRTVLAKTHYAREMLGYGPGETRSAYLPFFWVGGLVMTLFPTLELGGTVVCGERTTPPSSMFAAAGAGAAHAHSTYPKSKMRIGLGMTETFGMYSWGDGPPDPARPVCPPLVEFEPGYEVQVVDAEGRPTADGGTGQILLRGPTLMLGLHKVTRETSFDAAGFYRTGDLGEVDGDVIYYVGRLGDMIKSSGANVSPAEVEREIAALDGVAAAHVVGLDDPERGQVVGAAVVPEASADLAPSALLDILKTRLSNYKVPRRLVLVRPDELPLTPSGKILKRELAELIQARSTRSPFRVE
ncbi:class I adenylate-forming enzyme family protein [Frankia gtarii]|uniref:class I adenylate-forming enzyme family protein n=1 Tax=Frankia gtarii TaxID=2950102 RepID=UPI0021C03714|nr:class I adenylate-forming enzyme family protein [Frankia gtarii]